MTALSSPTVFNALVGQDRVRAFLARTAESGSFSHAYLFVGPAGAGKTAAAKALASAALCGTRGCGQCDDCRRIVRDSHPDVKVYRPEGATYLVEQIREIVHDASLAPIRGSRKVYIVERAELLGDSAANAFLKTLEEPPPSVIIILHARTRAGVLPTIVSRCQVVPFRTIPASESTAILTSITGASEAEARSALVAAGNVMGRAKEILMSSSGRSRHGRVLSTLADIETMDDLDILLAAKSLLTEMKVALDPTAVVEENTAREFLTAAQRDRLEKQAKRELSARERRGFEEIMNISRSWVRDALVLAEGATDIVLNADAPASTMRLSHRIDADAAARALRAIDSARRRVSYNVSPQLALEALLFELKEVLGCPR